MLLRRSAAGAVLAAALLVPCSSAAALDAPTTKPLMGALGSPTAADACAPGATPAYADLWRSTWA